MRSFVVTSLFSSLVASLLAAGAARADGGFAPIPAEQTGGKKTGLELRIVGYDGATNGELSVEVRNPKPQPVEFVARGLYFVPAGSADQAPQRLGAVGPFRVDSGDGWQPRESFTLAPNTTVKVKLDVYCIDSHRASPSSATRFRVAKDRVPHTVVEAIGRDAAKAAAPLGGVSSPEAKSAVQSEVWKNRDKKWIELDGEGAQEAGKKRK
jgi:hypothetical protein